MYTMNKVMGIHRDSVETIEKNEDRKINMGID